MVIDTSAIIAILTQEPDWKRLSKAIDDASSLRISAASVLETSIVLESRFGPLASKAFDQWLDSSSVEGIVLTREQVEAARAGFRRYGKGRHRAALNFGDCFAYGLAKTCAEPLLFCGNDFSLTDIPAVLSR